MATRKKPNGHIPRSVARKLLEHGARGAKGVVVTYKNGVPSRVFGYDEHNKVIDNAKQVKPWEHRKASTPAPDPLGAMDAGIQGRLTREAMYE